MYSASHKLTANPRQKKSEAETLHILPLCNYSLNTAVILTGTLANIVIIKMTKFWPSAS